ncbi:hypothetical protein PIB30_084017 [Stylosanthes scabra]|uniref:Ribonuclease H1 N-terminal domain-containing protein n=1 Tax=Stylosanthes scabra TaxID=79078 RepID=A0ABU6WSC6_9FABA|nr:hypothetical protein [Stylosanthes scabra]
MEEGRYQYYAVRAGRCPRIYTSWVECNKQVLGYKRCSFKGFHKLEDALAYMSKDGGKDSEAGVDPRVDADAAAVQTRLEQLKVFDGVTQLESSSSKPRNHVSPETTSSSKKDGMRFVLEEDMVHMLGRCCSALKIPEPYFYRRETRCRNGESGVAVATSLPENNRGLEITTFGGVFSDEGEPMQDAAFKLLEKLLEAEGLAIRDFNYRIVERNQAKIFALNRRLEMPINEQVRELETENNMMKAELEAFHEACSGFTV